jgi:hypothetical protein
MEMSKYFVCCEKCFHALGKKSGSAAKLWMDLCALRCQYGGIIKIHEQSISHLSTLENLGFVLSTENAHGLSIKVNGHFLTHDGEPCFCIKAGKHG